MITNWLYRQNLCVCPVYVYNTRSEFVSRLVCILFLFLKLEKKTSHTVAKFIGVAKLEIFSFIDGKKAYFKSFH